MQKEGTNAKNRGKDSASEPTYITIHGSSKKEDVVIQLNEATKAELDQLVSNERRISDQDIRHPKYRLRRHLKEWWRRVGNNLRDVRRVVDFLLSSLQRLANCLVSGSIAVGLFALCYIGVMTLCYGDFTIEKDDNYRGLNLTRRRSVSSVEGGFTVITDDGQGESKAHEEGDDSWLTSMIIEETQSFEVASCGRDILASSPDLPDNSALSSDYAALLELYPGKGREDPIVGTDLRYSRHFPGSFFRAFSADFWVCLPNGQEDTCIITLVPNQIVEGEVRNLEFALIDRASVNEAKIAADKVRELHGALPYDDVDQLAYDAAWEAFLKTRKPLARIGLSPELAKRIELSPEYGTIDNAPTEVFLDPAAFSALKVEGKIPTGLEIPEDTARIMHYQVAYSSSYPFVLVNLDKRIFLPNGLTSAYILVAVIMLVGLGFAYFGILNLFGNPSWYKERYHSTKSEEESENTGEATANHVKEVMANIAVENQRLQGSSGPSDEP